VETIAPDAMHPFFPAESRTGDCLRVLCRSLPTLLGKLGILLPILFGAHQLIMNARADSHARIEVAESYIARYEDRYLTLADAIDDVVNDASNRFGPFSESPDAGEFGKLIRRGFDRIEGENNGFNPLSAHYRAMFRCIEDGRCHEQRIKQIYEGPVCIFWSNWENVVKEKKAWYAEKGIGSSLKDRDWQC